MQKRKTFKTHHPLNHPFHIPNLNFSTLHVLVEPKEKKYQSPSTKKNLCIERREDQVTVVWKLVQEIRWPRASCYQRGAHTCLHVCRSGDKRGQNVTVQPWSERSELGSPNHREHRARSVLPPRILRAGVFLTPKVLVLDVTREFTRSSPPCWSGNTVRVCPMRVQTCS